jgi:hypothetical protein
LASPPLKMLISHANDLEFTGRSCCGDSPFVSHKLSARARKEVVEAKKKEEEKAASRERSGRLFHRGLRESASVMSFEMTDTPKAGLALAPAALHEDFLFQSSTRGRSSFLLFPLGGAELFTSFLILYMHT